MKKETEVRRNEKYKSDVYTFPQCNGYELIILSEYNKFVDDYLGWLNEAEKKIDDRTKWSIKSCVVVVLALLRWKTHEMP